MRAKDRSFRPLGQVLDAEGTLAGWSHRHAREAELTREMRRHLPRALGERLRVSGIEDGALVVTVPTGTIAAALRLRGPSLVRALQDAGGTISGLRIRVHPDSPPAPAPAAAARSLDPQAAAPLFDLAARLADGPLKRSLARWSRRARGR